jgi:hypothetical protein
MDEEKKKHLYIIEWDEKYNHLTAGMVGIFDDRQISQHEAIDSIAAGRYNPFVVTITKEQARNVFGMKNLS